MITSTIKFSQIEDRIDAEYYKPEYVEVERFLRYSENVFTIGEIIKSIQHPREFKREYSAVGGIPYLRVSNVKEGYIDLSDIEYVYTDRNIGLNKINTGNILITRSGTVGIPVLVVPEFDGMLISADFLKLVLKDKINHLEINPYFIYIFLSSKLGLSQSQRKLIGALQKHINTEGLSSIKILIPPQSFQQKIEEMVKEAQKKRKLADEKYKEAEEILNKELGLGNLDLSTQKTFEAKFSEAEDRFDPEYYQPKYKKIKNFLLRKKLTTKPLKSFVKKYNCGFAFPTDIYLEKGIPLLRIKNLKRMEIDFEGVEFLPDLNEYQEFIVKPGDILISMSGTVGVASLVPANIPKAFVNQRITSISTEGIDKLYLCLYLNLASINGLMNRETTGGVQKNITYQDIISVPVPILSQSLQQKTSLLIQESFKLRREAKELIDRAKKEVEEMVEGN